MGIFDSINPVSAVASGVGFLGSMFASVPEWKDAQFQGVDASRYGFQGVYQKFLTEQNQKLKQ